MVAASVLLLYSHLPLGTAIQFGGDEGYELMKALVHSHGFDFYTQIWNDQPSLFPQLLSQAFAFWGPSIFTARLVAAGFGLILFLGFFQMVKLRAGTLTGFFAVLFLAASPAILKLSVSVMQEVPAFAVGTLSSCILLRWRDEEGWVRLAVSGFLMGVALALKLTPAMIIPALWAEVMIPNALNPIRSRKRLLCNLTLWIALTTASFCGIAALSWGKGAFAQLFGTHVAEHAVAGMGSPRDFHLPLSVFIDHLEITAAAFVALLFCIQRRDWRPVFFPAVLLLIVLAVHAVHRPWWMYYYLHIAIPLSWLAAYGIKESLSVVVRSTSLKSPQPAPSFSTRVIFCVIIAFSLTRSASRLRSGIEELHRIPPVSDSPIVAKMQLYAKQTHWAYAEPTAQINCFHAGLLMPPELVGVSLKRFWSDQITTREIVDTCQRYRVEQLILVTEISDEWTNLIKDYEEVFQGHDLRMYVSKRIRN